MSYPFISDRFAPVSMEVESGSETIGRKRTADKMDSNDSSAPLSKKFKISAKTNVPNMHELAVMAKRSKKKMKKKPTTKKPKTKKTCKTEKTSNTKIINGLMNLCKQLKKKNPTGKKKKKTTTKQKKKNKPKKKQTKRAKKKAANKANKQVIAKKKQKHSFIKQQKALNDAAKVIFS